MSNKFKTYIGLLCISSTLSAQNHNSQMPGNPALAQTSVTVKRMAPAHIEEEETRVILSGKDFKAIFYKDSGILTSYQYRGKEYIHEPSFSPHFQLAKNIIHLTDEQTNALKNSELFPKVARFEAKSERGFIRETDPNGDPGNMTGRESQITYSIVEFTYVYPEIEGELTLTYTVFQNGIIKVESSLSIPEKFLSVFSNIGLSMDMSGKFNELTYCGKEAETVLQETPSGVACQERTIKVKELSKQAPYFSQHNKGLTAYWFAFTNKKNEGLLFIAEDSLQLNVFRSGKSTKILMNYPALKINREKANAAQKPQTYGSAKTTIEYGFNMIPLDKKSDFREKIKRY